MRARAFMSTSHEWSCPTFVRNARFILKVAREHPVCWFSRLDSVMLMRVVTTQDWLVLPLGESKWRYWAAPLPTVSLSLTKLFTYAQRHLAQVRNHLFWGWDLLLFFPNNPVHLNIEMLKKGNICGRQAEVDKMNLSLEIVILGKSILRGIQKM